MTASAPLCLTGSATIAQIPSLQNELVAAIADPTGDVLLDFSKVGQADVTLVQLVLSARIALHSKGRTLGVAAWSDAAAEAFARAGVAPESLAPSPATSD